MSSSKQQAKEILLKKLEQLKAEAKWNTSTMSEQVEALQTYFEDIGEKEIHTNIFFVNDRDPMCNCGGFN